MGRNGNSRIRRRSREHHRLGPNGLYVSANGGGALRSRYLDRQRGDAGVTLFPVGLSPELVAGSPLSVDIIKCQLKPIDMNDYKVSFSTQQRAKLQAIFPTGVCDWSKKGVKQAKSRTWASFGPSPVNQVFDIQDRRRHGDDDDDD